MDRILRGIRIGQDATYAPDTHLDLDQEESPMQTAPPRYAPLIDDNETEEELAPVAVVAKRSDILKVSSRSRPSAVAGAIAGVVRESGDQGRSDCPRLSRGNGHQCGMLAVVH